jgi:hypothetical protein
MLFISNASPDMRKVVESSERALRIMGKRSVGAIVDDKALAREATMDVNKITWAQAGGVTDPGRYMFRFGWLTITADDLAVWQPYPNAAFTLIRGTAPPPAEDDEQPAGEEF